MPTTTMAVLVIATLAVESGLPRVAADPFVRQRRRLPQEIQNAVRQAVVTRQCRAAKTAKIISGTVIARRRFMGMVPGFVRNSLFAKERQEECAERVKRRHARR